MVQLAPIDTLFQSTMNAAAPWLEPRLAAVALRFATAWEDGGGVDLYGAPRTAVISGRSLIDGTPRIV